MVVQQQRIQFSAYSLLYDLIDFSFIYDELLSKNYSKNGRAAESPVLMFKYLVLKNIYTISAVDVLERSDFDISF